MHFCKASTNLGKSQSCQVSSVQTKLPLMHTYNLYLYTIKNVKANKLVGSCANKIHKLQLVGKELVQEINNSYKNIFCVDQ